MPALNEYQLVFWGFGSLNVIAITAMFYALGGRANKWLRRFIAPFILVAWCSFWTQHALVAWGAFPLYAAAWSLGYGPNSSLARILYDAWLVRAVTGMAYALAALPILFAGNGDWTFFGAHLLLVAAMVTYLGTRNPLPAALEETVICAVSILLVPFFLA